MAEPFAKLYRSIFESSIMEAAPMTRLVWDYMLVLGYPEGVVAATPETLARRMNLPLADVRQALIDLAAPDPMSQTPDEDGKRIVLLDPEKQWGWRIVNFLKYLEKKQDRTAYFAERYQKKKAAAENDDSNTEITHVYTVESTSSTHKREIESERKRAEKKEAESKAKRLSRAARLVYDPELVRIVPDIQALWEESRVIRDLTNKTTDKAEQKQLDKLVRWAKSDGAEVVRASIDYADSGSYQGIFKKMPENRGNGRPPGKRRHQAGAQPEDKEKLLDKQLGWVQGQVPPEWIK